jgi:hypothetical protein
MLRCGAPVEWGVCDLVIHEQIERTAHKARSLPIRSCRALSRLMLLGFRAAYN